MSNTIKLIVFVTSTVASLTYMYILRNTVKQGQIDNTNLSKRESLYVFLCVVFSPLIAGAIFYYGWIKGLPKKAKMANLYSLVVAVIFILIYFYKYGM